MRRDVILVLYHRYTHKTQILFPVTQVSARALTLSGLGHNVAIWPGNSFRITGLCKGNPPMENPRKGPALRRFSVFCLVSLLSKRWRSCDLILIAFLYIHISRERCRLTSAEFTILKISRSYNHLIFIWEFPYWPLFVIYIENSYTDKLAYLYRNGPLTMHI